MCGICGKLVWNDGGVVSPDLIGRMNATLAHRGPDGEGDFFWDAPGVGVGFGHRRLSIIDLSHAGHQPMPNEARTVWIAHNGEVYNFAALRRELESLGFAFRSATDTEVVLRAYEAWGPDCVDHLEGMFAFAVFDQTNRRLMLARDRMGIKPLYYAATDHSLAFASEMKALLEDPSLPRNIDPAAIDRFLAFGYVPAPDTIFPSVKKLPPAHVLVWEDGEVRTRRYWRYRPSRADGAGRRSEAEWLEELREVFRAAVARQMVSDVPLGAFLSGGIDSSLIVWMMSQSSVLPVKSFTVGFGGDAWSEAPYARTVSNRFATDHAEYDVTPDALSILPQLVWHLDEPFGDSSVLPTYYVSKMTRERVTVALSGDGGDELFAGYTRYAGERFTRMFQRLPAPVRAQVSAVLRSTVLRRGARARRLGRVLADAELDFVHRYRNKQSMSSPVTRTGLYAADFRSGIPVDNDIETLLPIAAETDRMDFVDRLTVLDIEFYLPNDMLTKVDRMSMASSLEVRVPFLDEAVIEVASRIPTRLKLRGLTTKYILRKLAASILPPAIFRRKKQGFGIPVHAWFRGQLDGAAREILLDRRALGRGYFDRGAVERVLAEHGGNTADHGHLIFSLIALETWHRVFIDGNGA